MASLGPGAGVERARAGTAGGKRRRRARVRASMQDARDRRGTNALHATSSPFPRPRPPRPLLLVAVTVAVAVPHSVRPAHRDRPSGHLAISHISICPKRLPRLSATMPDDLASSSSSSIQLKFNNMSDQQLRQTISQLSNAATSGHYQAAFAAPTPQRSSTLPTPLSPSRLFSPPRPLSRPRSSLSKKHPKLVQLQHATAPNGLKAEQGGQEQQPGARTPCSGTSASAHSHA